ncbi:MAG: divalent cation tolerance protein CutA [Fulvivirga sp.]|nr:divalent cation tolerance protein CutA [Fulvivirga sp.]
MIVIFYKAKNENEGAKVASELLNSRLSNSIDQLPMVKSFSYAQGKIKEDHEVLLIIKTKALLYTAIENKVKGLTKSNNPKMYSVPMTQIDDKYRQLLRRGIMEA